MSAAHIKFAVVALTSLTLAGGAALRDRVTSKPRIDVSVTEPARTDGATARSDANETVENGAELADAEEPPQSEGNPKNRLLAVFQRADVTNNMVTFAEDKGRSGKSRTLPLAADASITVNMKPARLADLKPGCKLKLFLTDDGSRIIGINVKDIGARNLDGKKSR
jgi:hypothetical protein